MRNQIWCISDGMEMLPTHSSFTYNVPAMNNLTNMPYQVMVTVWKPVSMGPTRYGMLPYSITPTHIPPSEIIKTTPYGY